MGTWWNLELHEAVLFEYMEDSVGSHLDIDWNDHIRTSQNRRALVVQDFIPNLYFKFQRTTPSPDTPPSANMPVYLHLSSFVPELSTFHPTVCR